MQVHDIFGLAALGLIVALAATAISPKSTTAGVLTAAFHGFTQFTQAATQQQVTTFSS